MPGKKYLIALIALLLVIAPVAVVITQEGDEETGPMPRLEITGVNPNDLPTVLITTNVFESIGQPARNLGIDDFAISGELADIAEITSVENVTDDNLPIAAVLVIDTSSSMSGTPIEQAKEAAIIFVDNLGEDDQVAVITFDSQARLVLDYTSDKALLRQTINDLEFGGQTALYDAGLLAVQTANDAPFPRRTVVLLSDGAEFGDGGFASIVERGEALAEAEIRGVPIYTIGLGFGIDRTYLQELASGTNAINYESPTPEELPGIYGDLAGFLRTQYIVTLDIDVPLDGTEYSLTLQAETANGPTNEATTTVRAPIPVPIVNITGIPEEPISEPTDITLDIAADDGVETVTAMIEGQEGVILEEEPFVITVDPIEFEPGTYTLNVTASDTDGDADSASATFEIAALPSDVTITPDLTGVQISEPTTITVQATGQTPTETVAFTLGDETTVLEEAPYSFTIDPANIQPGEQPLIVEVVNEGGAVAVVEQPLTIAALPPEFTIVAPAEDGGTLEGSFLPGDVVDFAIDITQTQTEITEVIFSVDGETVAAISEPPYVHELELFGLGSGARTLEVTVSNAGGASATQSITVNLTVIPTPTPTPTATFTPSNTPTATSTPTPTVDRQATADAQATSEQQALIQATGTANAVETGEAIATNEAQGTQDAEATAAGQATGTAESIATGEAIATNEAQGTQDAQATAFGQATSTAESAATQSAQNTQEFQATQDAQEQATQAAQNTQEFQATQDAQEQATQAAQNTQEFQATQDAQEQATQAAQNTQEFQATQDEQEQATQAAQAEATRAEQATQDAQGTQDANATLDARETATATAQIEASATADAQQETQTAEAQQTTQAEQQLTQTTEAEQDATQDAQASANLRATATAESQATETQQAEEQATQNALATENSQATETQQVEEQATQNAQATENSQATETQQAEAQATQNALATENSQATETQQAEAQATQNALATETQQAEEQATQNALATENSQATETQQAEDEQATATAAEAAAIAQASTETAEATEEETEEPTATATATPTEEVTEEPTEEVIGEEVDSTRTPSPTLPPSGPLTQETVDEDADDGTDFLPIALIVGAVLLLLLLLFFLFGRRRNTDQQG